MVSPARFPVELTRNASPSPLVGAGDQSVDPCQVETALASAMSETADHMISSARAALEAVTDPELPFLTLADLGILRDVRLDGEVLDVVITPTYSGCPAMDVIALDIELALARAGFRNTRVRSVSSPAWTTDWLTESAREKLRANGIAPPAKASGKRALFSTEVVACPQCGSTDTDEISGFGSTACKAQRRCRTCREPFEHFKCI